MQRERERRDDRRDERRDERRDDRQDYRRDERRDERACWLHVAIDDIVLVLLFLLRFLFLLKKQDVKKTGHVLFYLRMGGSVKMKINIKIKSKIE